MTVDMGKVKQHIKPKAYSTLCNMKKADLVDYIRCLEHNYNVAVSFNENQAKYIESLDAVPVVRCQDCKHYSEDQYGCVCNFHSQKESEDYPAFQVQMLPWDFCSHGERR